MSVCLYMCLSVFLSACLLEVGRGGCKWVLHKLVVQLYIPGCVHLF